VSLSIYNILGEEIRTLVNDQFMSAGYQTIVWNARTLNGDRVPSGVYFILMKSGAFMQTKKMILLK
jgi:flagellar hook assembly protein FlgD